MVYRFKARISINNSSFWSHETGFRNISSWNLERLLATKKLWCFFFNFLPPIFLVLVWNSDFCLKGCFANVGSAQVLGSPGTNRVYEHIERSTPRGGIFWGSSELKPAIAPAKPWFFKKHTHIIGMDMENRFYFKRFFFASDDIKRFFKYGKGLGFQRSSQIVSIYIYSRFHNAYPIFPFNQTHSGLQHSSLCQWLWNHHIHNVPIQVNKGTWWNIWNIGSQGTIQ